MHPVRWDRWLDIVDEHQLGPFLGSRIRLCSELALRMPVAVQEELYARTVRSSLDASFRSVEHFRLCSLLERETQPIALKGSALALTLYAETAEREMSDLDLLIPEDDIELAEAILEREGFVPLAASTINDKHHHRRPLFNGTSELTIELHTNLSTPKLPKTAIVEMGRMRRAVEIPGAGTIHVLDPISLVLHHALHAVADPIDSPLLRNLFEVAWLVRGLSRLERSTVRTLARRWGIEARVASALSLAHQLFGSPLVFDKAMIGARERWCLARLDWTRSFGPKTSLVRFVRDLARRHMRALDRGASGKNPWPLISGVASAVWSALENRVRQKFQRRPQLLEPVTLYTAPVGGYLVAHDARTGNVHVLDRLSAKVFKMSKTEHDAQKLELMLEQHGVESEAARYALDQLVDRGVIREHIQGSQV
jgi:hypothetical protein